MKKNRKVKKYFKNRRKAVVEIEEAKEKYKKTHLTGDKLALLEVQKAYKAEFEARKSPGALAAILSIVGAIVVFVLTQVYLIPALEDNFPSLPVIYQNALYVGFVINTVVFVVLFAIIDWHIRNRIYYLSITLDLIEEMIDNIEK